MRQTTTINLEDNPVREINRIRRLGEVWVHFNTFDSIAAGVSHVLGTVFRFCIDSDGLPGLLVETQRSEHGGTGMVFVRLHDIVAIDFDPDNVKPLRSLSDSKRIRKIRKEARTN